MTRYRAVFFLTLFLLMCGLAGRSDMQTEQRVAQDKEDARQSMRDRAGEDACGALVAVKRGDRWECVPLKRSM